jgi:UDP-N-acetylglucosamine 2-epimerase (non-hydrolysing)
MNNKPKILCVVGARPNFVKIAPILAALRDAGRIAAYLCHTGQHYDADLNDTFFRDLDIPRPDANLDVGSGSHAVQTAEVMKRFEPVVDAERPLAVLVVGDVNSTLAAGLVAAKKDIPVVHVEAGLRSFDRTMPEEVNRVLTDQISGLLFATEPAALENLAREGIPAGRIRLVGNVMIDALRRQLPSAQPPEKTLAASGGRPAGGYAVLTLHRPSNVDDPATLGRLLRTIAEIGRDLPIVFPVHPRTRARIDSGNLGGLLSSSSFRVLPPVGYLEMLGLVAKAALVLTDSGGLQEETTALGIPCLTLRDNTERPITVSEGTNTLVGNQPDVLAAAYAEFRRSGGKRGQVPALWDGRAAARIAQELATWLGFPAA